MQSRMGSEVTTSSLYSVSNLLGSEIWNHEGENLGKLEDIVVDFHEGRISYGVLSFGGFLGLGSKLFAIPWEALEYSADGERLILNVPKERLENAPGFDRDNWPNMADRTWQTSVYEYYGYEPYWSRGEGQPRRRRAA